MMDDKIELIKERIRNQLKIHWHWLHEEEDADDVANMIDAWIGQAVSGKK